MPAPRAVSNWPSVGERRSRCTLQYATAATSPSFVDFGTWFAKVTVAPFVTSGIPSAMFYALEGPYRADIQSYHAAGTGLRAIVNEMTLKVFQVENPLLRNRTLVLHAKAIVWDLLITVIHEAFASRNGDGTPTYSTGVSRLCFVEPQDDRVSQRIGQENVPSLIITFPDPVTVTMDDRFTFPDGTQPPIHEIRGVQDPEGGNFRTQVRFGSQTRSR